MTRRHADVFRFLGRLIREYRRIHSALYWHYRRRSRGPLTPEQEAARDIARMHREQEAIRRLTWRR